MATRYCVPVAVELAPDGVPAAFTWREKRYSAVRLLGTWRLATGRWNVAQRIDRTYFRVETADHQVFELYFDGVSHAWVLEVVQN
jgi:hypothetical protein